MNKSTFIYITVILAISILFTGCINHFGANGKNPVILSLWHNYGGQMKDTMDEMIDEFNETTGAENGIMLSVTSISGSAILHENLTMAASGDPGAPPLPDITTAYPKTALILVQKDLLVNLENHFTSKELSFYIPHFLEEGKITDDGLYVFPIAKSTEVLYVNKTIFNRFAKDTGVSLEDLKTFEGLIKASALYYDWTDNQTPDVPNDGKAFYMPDSLFNLAQIGYNQLDSNFLVNESINLSPQQFTKIWECFYTPAVMGHLAIFEGYASDLAKTGDIVCSTGSTAGVVFFPPSVTYPDNTSEPVDLEILPYPVFEGGRKVAIQRGGGMCVLKSTKEKEKAAAMFLKWFTKPENNLKFVSSTGYLPVTEEAFGEIMTREIEEASDNNIKKLLQTAQVMQRDYDFFIPPLFDGIDELEKKFEAQIKEHATSGRELYIDLLNTHDSLFAYEKTSNGAYEQFITQLRADLILADE